MTRFPTLNAADLEHVSALQASQQRSWRSIPLQGMTAECSGELFTVLPNVFPPRGDTRLLLDNLHVERGTAVLDMGTGCGVLAIIAIKRGAKAAVAIDINPDAVRNAIVNAKRHGVQAAVQVRLSDGFSAIAADERFDLILANLPGRNKTAANAVESAQWDSGFKTHKSLFARAPDFLAPGGKILMTKANYPELNDVVGIAEQSGFTMTVLAKKNPVAPDPRTYYVLAFSR